MISNVEEFVRKEAELKEKARELDEISKKNPEETDLAKAVGIKEEIDRISREMLDFLEDMLEGLSDESLRK